MSKQEEKPPLLTVEEFDEKYTGDNSVASENFSQEDEPGQFETFGNDLAHVQKIAEEDPLRCWTMVEGEEGLTLIQGYWAWDRVYFIITKERAEKPGERYLFEGLFDDDEDEDDYDDEDGAEDRADDDFRG